MKSEMNPDKEPMANSDHPPSGQIPLKIEDVAEQNLRIVVISAAMPSASETGQDDVSSPVVHDAHAALTSAQSVGARPAQLRNGDDQGVFVTARMSKVAWAVHESVHRAFRMVLAAALDVPLDGVKCSTGEHIGATHLCSAATYSLSLEDAMRLGTAKVQNRLRVGVALLGDKHLWVSDALESRYAAQPWRKMLALVQCARDEIKAKRLPSDVVIKIEASPHPICLGADLAPRRPPLKTQRKVVEFGHSNGYMHRRDHKLHFAKDNGRDVVDIHFDESKFLKQVDAVSGLNPPWIEVEYVEEQRDNVVFCRIMTGLKVRTDSLFDSGEKMTE